MLLFIALLLGNISWKGASRFSGEGRGFVFQMGGFIFKWGCAPWEGIGFDGGIANFNKLQVVLI